MVGVGARLCADEPGVQLDACDAAEGDLRANGDFCIRCHTQIGMQREEKLFTSNLKRHPASIEGITCVVCHRVDRAYGKVSGRTAIVEGDLLQPVYGPKGNAILKAAIKDTDKYKIQDKDIDRFATRARRCEEV